MVAVVAAVAVVAVVGHGHVPEASESGEPREGDLAFVHVDVDVPVPLFHVHVNRDVEVVEHREVLGVPEEDVGLEQILVEAVLVGPDPRVPVYPLPGPNVDVVANLDTKMSPVTVKSAKITGHTPGEWS